MLFLSCESQAPAGNLLVQIQKNLEPELKKIIPSAYGPELEEIAIISIVVGRDIILSGAKERKYFSRKKRYADIRLFLDYEKFIRVNPEKRYRMYIEHIIKSLEVLRGKVSTGYLLDELIFDVSNILEKSEMVEKCSAIKKIPG